MTFRDSTIENGAMAKGKYIKDYRLLETVDERGRIHTDYEYIGENYYYVRGAAAIRADRLRAGALCAAGVLLLVGGLLPNSLGMRALYVSLPYIFAALPLGLLADTLLFSLPANEPLQHRQADRLQNRYPAAGLAAGVLPCISLLGQGVRLLLGAGMNGGDAILSLCALGAAGCGFGLFALRGRFAVRKG